jgi:hypothetical protein
MHIPCADLPNGIFPSGFQTNILYAFRMSAACPTHQIFHLIALIVFGEEQAYKL